MTGRKDEALCRVLSIRAYETDTPSFSIFCLVLADFLIIVNQCAFIFKLFSITCVFLTHFKNWGRIKLLYIPFVGYSISYAVLQTNEKDKYACFSHVCKGSHSSKFKKIKNEGANAGPESVLCHNPLHLI